MLVHGLGQLLAYIFDSNNDMVLLFQNSVLSLEGLKDVFVLLLSKIGIDWFTHGIGLYLPFGVMFILTYGYSITWRKKHKKVKEDNNQTEENNK